MTRHRVPAAPASRRSRRSSEEQPVGPALADSIVAGALDSHTGAAQAVSPTAADAHDDRFDDRFDDDVTPPHGNPSGGYEPVARERFQADVEADLDDLDVDEDHASGEYDAVVVQDRGDDAAGAPNRARRQLVTTILSAVCVVSIAGVLVTVTQPSTPPLGADDTGFGNVSDTGPIDPSIPHSLLGLPDSGTQSPVAQGPANGTGDGPLAPVARGVAALFGGAGSPWVVPVGGMSVDPSSSSIVSGMNHSDFHISSKEWSVPVYYADASTPRHDVPLSASWMNGKSVKSVPVPSNAKPDPSEDAHLTIVDRSKGCIYDFWSASGSGGSLSAQSGNAMPLDGSGGAYAGGLGSRASGFSGAAGLITPEDLKKGSIDHALVFAYPNTRSGGPVSPATGSDGKTGGGDALPEGGRVRLDPSLNLASLGLNKYELMIAKAMQRYGMILGDTSGGFTIYAQNPQSLPGGTWGGLLPDDQFIDISKIPTDKLQVLALGAQKSGETSMVSNRCNGF